MMAHYIQSRIDDYLARLSDEQLLALVRTHVFARLTPPQNYKLAQALARRLYQDQKQDLIQFLQTLIVEDPVERHRTRTQAAAEAGNSADPGG